jgi:hypothetical protein
VEWWVPATSEEDTPIGFLAVDVNEENRSAPAFYEALGFSVMSRSLLDSAGPFPILHMRRARSPL